MEELKTVQLAIIDFLAQQPEPASSEKIANNFGLSSKTVRNYMTEIDMIIQKYGAHIEAKTGSGFSVIKDNEELFIQFLNDNQSIIRRSYAYLTNNVQRAHFIVRYLLMQKDYIVLEDLSEILFMNRTSILQDLEISREILKKFDIMLESKSKLGIRVLGSEINIRNCILYERNFYLNSSIDYDNKNYHNYYEMNEDILHKLQDIIYKSQNIMKKIYLSAKTIQEMAELIVICSRRGEQGNIIDLDEDLSHFSDRNSYYIARYIISQSETILNYEFSKEEIIYLTIYILANKTVISEEEITNYDEYLRQKDIAFDLVMYLNNSNEFKYMKSDLNLINEISYNLPMIQYRLKYHFIQAYYELEAGVPIMAIHLAMQSAEYLKNVMDLEFNDAEIVRLAQLIYPAFGRYSGEVKKYSAMIVSKYDKNIAKSIAERIKRNFSKYLSSLDIYDRMDLNYNDCSKYHIIFTDFNDTSLVKHNDNQIIVPITLYFDENDKSRIRQKLLFHDAERLTDVNDLVQPDLFFHDIDVKNKIELFNEIEKKIGEKIELLPGLAHRLEKDDELYCPESQNNYAIIMPLKRFSDKNFIAFFILKKAIQWKAKKCQVVVLIHQGVNTKQENMFETELACHIIELACKNNNMIDSLIKGDNYQAIEAIVEESNQMIIAHSKRIG